MYICNTFELDMRFRRHLGCDSTCMVVGFTNTCAIRAYHH